MLRELVNTKWIRYSPDLPPKTITYFCLALECDFPILESLHYSLADYVFWSEVDYIGMAQYFYMKFMTRFITNFDLSTKWVCSDQSKTAYTAMCRKTSFTIMIFDENQYDFGGKIVRMSLTNGLNVALMYLEMDDDNRFFIRTLAEQNYEKHLRFDGKTKFLSRDQLDSQIEDALVQFFAENHHLINK